MTTTKTVKTPMPTPTPTVSASLPFGGISATKLTKAAEVFSHPHKVRADVSYATAQFINGKPPYSGLYIDKNDLQKMGWYGLPLPEGAKEEGKIPFGQTKDKKPGILFELPYFIVVDASPRFVEVSNDGGVAYKEAMKAYQDGKPYDPYHIQLGTPNSLVAIYCNADGSYSDPQTGRPYTGKDLYEACEPGPDEKNLVSLRTFYLIFLCNPDGELLHSKPVCLSVKGLAAVTFGEALKSAGKALLTQLGEATGDTKLANSVLTRESLRDFLFVMKLEGATAGKNSNWITKIAEEDGVLQVGGDYIDDPELKKKLDAVYEANDGFAWKFAAQMASEPFAYHKLEGALSNLALPGTVDVTPAAQLVGLDDNSEKFDF